MPVYVPDNFDIGVAAPIDSRNKKTTTTERDAIPTGVRFDGLTVYITQDHITYQLQGGITNSNWIPIAGSSGGAEYLYNLLDVNITSIEDKDQLLYDSITSKWLNTQPAFILDSSSGEICSNSITTKVTVGAPIFNTSGGYYTVGGGRTTHIVTDDDGIFNINTTDGDLISYPILTQTTDGIIDIAGVTIKPTGDDDWLMNMSPGTNRGGILVSIDNALDSGLRILSNTDYLVADFTERSTKLYSANLLLGSTDSKYQNVDRLFVSNFDSYHFSIGSYNANEFLIHDVRSETATSFKLKEGYGDFELAYGIKQSASEVKGYLNVIPKETGDISPEGTGYITATDYIKTNTYFEGDSVFNHNTLVLTDVAGPNYCLIAEISVAQDEYVTVELDYVLPDSTIGINKGRVLMQAGFDPDEQTIQVSEILVTETITTSYIVDAAGIGSISILDTNSRTLPPFNTGDEIRLPGLFPEQLLIVELQDDNGSGYYVYSVLGKTSTDFTTTIGDVIFEDSTTLQEVTTVTPGESFITSLFDIKDKATGETGVTWKAVLNNIGTLKTISLFAQLTIEDTFLSYISKYQKEGTPTVTFYNTQDWISTLPTGTSEITAIATGGTSYWGINGDDLYNINTGNVSIGKSIANYKLDIDGEIGVSNVINFLSGTKLTATVEGSEYFKITNDSSATDLFNISDVGNVFINSTDVTGTEAKLSVTADENSTYAFFALSNGSGNSAVKFSGGAVGESIKAVNITDYLGNYSASITGNGGIDANKSISIEDGTIMNCTTDIFTYKGYPVWTNSTAGSLSLLSDVDLSGLAINNYLKWDGSAWTAVPITSGNTNLEFNASPTGGTITSDTGDDAELTLVNTLNAGLMLPSDKDKLDFISSGAEVNVQSDWTQVSNTHDAYIKNKPVALSEFTDDLGAAEHIEDTTIHVTQADKDAWNLANANEQADWTETNAELDSYIQNKPALTIAAITPVLTTVTAFSTSLVNSNGIYEAIDGLTISPATGYIRFGENTLRLTQGSTIIDIPDVPKLDIDGKVLASQTRTIAGGATQVFTTTAALETSIQTGTDVVSGDFIYITGASDVHNGMWIAAVLLTGVTWSMDTAVTSFDVLDVTTGADYYTQIEITNAFATNTLEAGDGLTGGGTLSYEGNNIPFAINIGNGLGINTETNAVEITEILGSPTGIIYTS